MKTRILLIFLALSFATIRSVAQNEEVFLDEEITGSINEQNATEYLIIAGTSSDYYSLLTFAKDLSLKTGIVYDDMGRVYRDSCIVNPEESDDELYRGTYVFRRWEFGSISIELNVEGIVFSPSGTSERPKMIIVAGMGENKKEAMEKLALIRKYVPTAYLKKKEVYMGCIH
jgi:hypothetical protein